MDLFPCFFVRTTALLPLPPCRFHDLPALSVHGLRHSNASLMINNGFDVKAISEHLGYCNTAITSDIYTHIFKEYKAKMAESIENDLI